jgi:hypothetical protein
VALAVVFVSDFLRIVMEMFMDKVPTRRRINQGRVPG